MYDPILIQQSIDLIRQNNVEIPQDPAAIINLANELRTVSQTGREVMDNISNVADAQEQIGIQQEEINNMASKPFNLFKRAQEQPFYMDDMVLNDNPELTGDETEMQEVSGPPFLRGADLADWMNTMERFEARNQILGAISGENQQIAEDLMDAYYEIADMNKQEMISTQLFEMLPSEWHKTDMEDDSTVIAPFVEAIENTENIIKKLAQEYVEKHKKEHIFNLQKTAQHKGFDTAAIMYGPSQVRIDPFYRQPISDYSIIERNKGFGLVVDDFWNIDWEAIWRGTVMDKYSRPYRDNDGKWVGGYIQKRFEVDKNIPETNNLQLKPGQTRKPYLPQFAGTEARLEDMREKNDRGYGPFSEGKPFNWKEAKKKT